MIRQPRRFLEYTRAAMLELTPAQRRTLKSLAHHIAPVVLIGDAGLTPAVLREIEVHLNSHELIKVRVAGDDRDARAGIMAAICEAHNAAPVQQIGKILVVYRPKPDEPEEAPQPQRSPRPRTPRSTKKPKAAKAAKSDQTARPQGRKPAVRRRKAKRSFQ